MSFRQTAFIGLASLVALAGCEFRPLYGDQKPAPVVERLAQVSVGTIADRTGQLLRNELRTRLDPNNKGLPPIYSLSVELAESTSRLAVRRDASATRANLTVRAQYRLVRSGTDTALANGSVRSVNSYDILSTENEFGTRTAELVARQRAASDLANQIAVRLSLVLERVEPSGR